MAQLLVIDDDPLVRQTVRRILGVGGHSIVEAESGAAGLAHLAEHHVDLVITDIIMPGMEGIETIKQIRRFRPSIKIIAISGSASRDVYLDASSKLGAQAILDKPFRGAELRDLVKRVLSEQGAEPE